MSLVGPATCLACGHLLPMRVLYAFAEATDASNTIGPPWLGYRSGLFVGKVGVECPQCQAKFVVTQRRVRAVRYSAFLALAACIALTGYWLRTYQPDASPAVEMAIVVVALLAAYWVQMWTPGRFASVRQMQDGEVVGFPLYGVYEGRHEEAHGDI
jgi:hypothetical protein